MGQATNSTCTEGRRSSINNITENISQSWYNYGYHVSQNTWLTYIAWLLWKKRLPGFCTQHFFSTGYGTSGSGLLCHFNWNLTEKWAENEDTMRNVKCKYQNDGLSRQAFSTQKKTSMHTQFYVTQKRST